MNIYNALKIPIWKTDNKKCTIPCKYYQYDDFNLIIKTLYCNEEKAWTQQVNRVHKLKINIPWKVWHKWFNEKIYILFFSIIIKNCSFYLYLILFKPILLLVFWLVIFFLFFLLLCNWSHWHKLTLSRKPYIFNNRIWNWKIVNLLLTILNFKCCF